MATAKKANEANAAKVMKVEVFYKNMTTKDGRKFKKWLTKANDGKIYQIEFVLLAKNNMPKARSILYVKEVDMNWNRTNPQYPKLYIKEIQSVEALESAPENWTNYFEEA